MKTLPIIGMSVYRVSDYRAFTVQQIIYSIFIQSIKHSCQDLQIYFFTGGQATLSTSSQSGAFVGCSWFIGWRDEWFKGVPGSVWSQPDRLKPLAVTSQTLHCWLAIFTDIYMLNDYSILTACVMKTTAPPRVQRLTDDLLYSQISICWMTIQY